jgi:DNA polymerase III alpha subunit
MSFDVDIDLSSKFNPKSVFPEWVNASIVNNDKLRSHPCGVYPQNIAIDPITQLAAIPYEQAEELGYFKLDFLHLNVYNHFSSRQEIEELLEIEPDWALMQIPSQVSKLFQLSKHLELLQKTKPNCVEDVADVLALIRPGKIELLPLYIKDKSKARKLLYMNDKDGYSFKKSHAISYALVIILQLHLISVGMI